MSRCVTHVRRPLNMTAEPSVSSLAPGGTVLGEVEAGVALIPDPEQRHLGIEVVQARQRRMLAQAVLEFVVVDDRVRIAPP